MALCGQRAAGACSFKEQVHTTALTCSIQSHSFKTLKCQPTRTHLAPVAAIPASTVAAPAPTTSTLPTEPIRSSSSVLRPGKSYFGWSHMWFETMVQMAVKQLNGSAFLLRVRNQGHLRFSYVPLSSEEVALGWSHIQQQYLQDSRTDDAVILVHPVPSEEQPCAVSAINCGQPCPGCPHTQPGPSSVEQTELLHGKLGDCCSDHDHDSSSGNRQHSHSSISHKHVHDSSHHNSNSVLSYHGLVVQTSNAADPLQGCYLLKTMQVKQQAGSVGGCHCTHYSLTRVCKGPSLQQQYQAAWLAN